MRCVVRSILGGALLLVSCGDPPGPEPLRITYSRNIQKDLKILSCGAVGCHSVNGSSRLQIDPTAGQEMVNYQRMLTNGILIPGNSSTSPLITVPSTGVDLMGAPHVKTLTGTKLTDWKNWVDDQAPF